LSFGSSAAIGNFALLKKLLAILLLVLYGVSSTGATVQMHYCCGKLKSIQLTAAPVKECGNKHKMGSKPCCETKQVSVKAQHQQAFYTITIGTKAPAEPQHYFNQYSIQKPAETTYDQQVDYSSPPLIQSICILNCVFRV